MGSINLKPLTKLVTVDLIYALAAGFIDKV